LRNSGIIEQFMLSSENSHQHGWPERSKKIYRQDVTCLWWTFSLVGKHGEAFFVY